MNGPYYHGGPKGRKRGAFILPAEATGAKSCSDFGAAHVHRRDRVYVTTSLEAAFMFAAMHNRPMVYEVEPVGPVEHDPDCNSPGLSFQCERALVINLYKPTRQQIALVRAALMGGVA